MDRFPLEVDGVVDDLTPVALKLVVSPRPRPRPLDVDGVAREDDGVAREDDAVDAARPLPRPRPLFATGASIAGTPHSSSETTPASSSDIA